VLKLSAGILKAMASVALAILAIHAIKRGRASELTA